MPGLNSQKLRLLESRRNEYLAQARKDVETRRAMHNAELQGYEQEIKPLKRQERSLKMRRAFANFGKSVHSMGPQG